MRWVWCALVIALTPLVAQAVSPQEGSVASSAKAAPSTKASVEAAAFFKAAQERDGDTLKAMLANGFDPNYADEYGQTAILYSIFAGDDTGVDILLDAGANPNTVDPHGDPILLMAAEEGYLEIVQLLVKKGVDVNRTGKDGSTPLIGAAGKNHLEVVKALIGAGADPDLVAANGATPIWAASYEGLTELVAYLLPLSKDVNVKDQTGHQTLLMNVINMAEANQSVMVKALLDRGADVNAVDERGWTPLMWAAKLDDAEIARMLLEKGADPNHRATRGETALSIAKKENHDDVSALLSKAKPAKANPKKKK